MSEQEPSGFELHPSQLPGIVPCDQGWMSDVEVAAIAFFARCLPRALGDVLEVGAWKGRTTSALLRADVGRVVVVDTFTGSEDMGGAGKFPVRRKFDENLLALFGRELEVLEVIEGDSRVELPKLAKAGRTFRVVLVDGDHRTEGALADLLDAWGMLAEGGYLFIDDTDWPSVWAAMERFSREIGSGMCMPVSHKLSYVRKVGGKIA